MTGERNKRFEPQASEYNTMRRMLLGTSGSTKKSYAGGILENLADTFTGFGRTLKVLPGTDLLRYGHTLRTSKRQTS